MHTLQRLCILAVSGLAAACVQTPPPEPVVAEVQKERPEDIRQGHLCEVQAWQHDVAKQTCLPGQKIVFLPERWGNEQLPVLFAAVNGPPRVS